MCFNIQERVEIMQEYDSMRVRELYQQKLMAQFVKSQSYVDNRSPYDVQVDLAEQEHYYSH